MVKLQALPIRLSWTKPTRALTLATGVIAKLIQSIEDLAAVLPTSIAEGTETDKIYHVITNIQGPDGDAWSTFNRRFDILFKEDAQCRDADGRLHLIRRGELGMTMVARYLRDIKWNAVEMNLDGAVGKLERLVKEMEYLNGMDAAAAKTAAAAQKSASASAAKKKNKIKAAEAAAAKETAYDNVFDAVMQGRKGKGDKEYRPPKQKPVLSEDEEDDFEDVVADAASTAVSERSILTRIRS
ncbi:hypothetical protein B0H13DRAFT_2330047 [Mycena leptocephala]|nr:hypothetical protein B0H13DRAFT_2330047 [Mycena leptocephala]